MRQSPVLLDITRLATRLSRLTPNGIDRVDMGFARHFFAPERRGQGVIAGPIGVRLTSTQAAGRLVAMLERHWREDDDAALDPALQTLAASVLDGTRRTTVALNKQGYGGASQWARRASAAATLVRSGVLPGHRMVSHAPENSIYINVSQFPVFYDGYFRWLSQRPDVKAVFFIHDLLPLTHPEFFPSFEARLHVARLDVVARRATGVIVTSEQTRDELTFHLKRLTGSVPKMMVFRIPVDRSFHSGADDGIAGLSEPYFVTIGTIEPRKNHLFLLHVWRELAARLGEKTPKLLMIGSRGWDFENVVDMLERCDALQGRVFEIRQLSTPAMRRVLRGAKALLMPSFAEGFGLPVAEACAVGVPVLAADLACYNGYAGELVTRLDPTDGPNWIKHILLQLEARGRMIDQTAEAASENQPRWVCRMSDTEEFILNL